MAIFTDSVRQIQAPSNTELTLALSRALGENNIGKALGDIFKDLAGVTHDYTYGTAMGIANDIKTARDEYGNLKDAEGRFINSNDRVRELLAQRNPKWSANNYADADMEAWYKGRDTEGRAIEDLILKKAAGDRDQQRVNIANKQFQLQLQKYNEEQEAARLYAEMQEVYKKSPDLVASWLDNNKKRLQANPTAYKQIMQDIAGKSNINILPYTAGDTGQIQLGSEDVVTDNLNEITAKENINNAGGFTEIVRPDLEANGKSLSELLQEKLKALSYDKDSNNAETFTTHFNRAATALKAAGATDKEAAALMRNADKEGFWHWSVNDYNVDALVDQWKTMNKLVGDTGKTELEMRRNNARILAQARENLASLEQGKAITALNNEYMQRRLRISQMLKAGEISPLDAERAFAGINSWFRQSMGLKQEGITRAKDLIKAATM